MNKNKYEKKRYQQNQHIARIPKINLKPTSCARRVFWRTNVYINNSTTGPPLPWFQTFNLNSPWIINNSSNTSGQGTVGSLSSVFNQSFITHNNGDSVNTGTAYRGLFESIDNAPGRHYRQLCVVGTKVRASFTPQFESADVQPAGLASIVLAGPNVDLSVTNFTAPQIEDVPYSRIRNVFGSQASLAAQGGLSNTKSATLSVNYSAKKFNDIKDIKDASQMWANVTRSGTSYVGSHPAEVDRVVIGLCPLMGSPLAGKSLPSGLMEISMEAVVLFREPSGTFGSDLAPLVDNSSKGVEM